jgi:hypothetical protein
MTACILARLTPALLAATLVLCSPALQAQTSAAPPWSDDFERGLARWQILGEGTARIAESNDPRHGRVLELIPNGDAAALIRGSDRWPRFRLEGEMLFRTDDESYLGFVYAFTEHAARNDFGLIYVKGDDNYLQVNPHRDFNVSRLLYPEWHVDLKGASAITIGAWQRFAIEVDGAAAHVYIGDTQTPQVTFQDYEGRSGLAGLQPRSVGGPVWVDNVEARVIDRLSYSGPPIPPMPARADDLVTGWQVAGPFERTNDALARQPRAAAGAWRAFVTDSRGAVVTGRVVDYHGPATVAYFRTTIEAPAAEDVELRLATIDDLAIWMNGAFLTFLGRQDAAWADAGENPSHPARRLPLSLRAGPNDIVIRVRGGVYASGGFFARLLRTRR